MLGTLTDWHWEEGKANNGGQVREHHLAAQLLLKPGSQLYLDPACRVSRIPITLHGRRLVEIGPAQVAESRDAIVIDGRSSCCQMSAISPGTIDQLPKETHIWPVATHNCANRPACCK